MGACNLPELLALDLEKADPIFAARRIAAGTPQLMDVVDETNSSIRDLYQANQSFGVDLDLDLKQLHSTLAKAAALAHVSPRSFSQPLAAPSEGESLSFACTSPPLEPFSGNRDATSGARSSLKSRSSSRRRDHSDQARPKSAKHAAASTGSGKTPGSGYFHWHRHRPPHPSPSHLHVSDPYQRPRPKSATSTSERADDCRYSLGSVVSISRTKSKSSRPASSQAVAPSAFCLATDKSADTGAGDCNTGEWDSSSVDSFELPNISLSRRDGRTEIAGSSGTNSARSLPSALFAPSVQHRIRLQEQEQLLQLQQLRQLQELQKQLAQQLQLQLQREQTQDGAATLTPAQEEPIGKELTSDCDKDSHHPQQDHLSYRFAQYNDGARRDSCDSYESLCDSCSYSHDNDTDNNASVCSLGSRRSTSHRHSSGGMTMLSSVGVRGRQRSIVTTATSVTSSGPDRRFSSQSRAPSAVGRPSSNAKGPGVPKASSRCASRASSVGGAAGSGVGSDRHVEFRLKCADKDTVQEDNDSIKASTATGSELSEVSIAPPLDHVKDTELSAVPHNLQKTTDTGHDPQSSWMRFDDDDDDDDDNNEDEEQDEEEKIYESRAKESSGAGIVRGMAKQVHSNIDDVSGGSFNLPILLHDSLPPRPKTSAGHFPRSASPDFGRASDEARKTVNRYSLMPAISCLSVLPQRQQQQHQLIAVPRRHSSLGHRSYVDSFGQIYSHQQLQHPLPGNTHRLRHLDLSLSDASMKSSTSIRRSSNGSSSLLPHYDRPNTSLPSHAPLQQTIGHIPATSASAIGTTAVTDKTHAVHHHSSRRFENGQALALAGQSSIQLGDNNNCNKVRADNDLDSDLFGDFEGAYNYDEVEDKIMMATAMPFSKQKFPPRSLDSVRLQRPHSSYQPREPTLEQDSYFAGGKRAHDKTNEMTSHLQSWIEHASRNQQELIQQQQRQQFDLSPMTSVFYEDDMDEAQAEGRILDDVAVTDEQGGEMAAEAVLGDDANAHGQASGSTTVTTTPTTTTTANPYDCHAAPQKTPSVPLLYLSQSGTVGIPLPREVVDTLRVSVSCFPETMLSLSSFSIQTIRSYSRKVRRCSQSDADDAYRLLLAPLSPSTASPPTCPPSPMTAAQYFPLSPASPPRSAELGTSVTRSTTAPSLSANGGRRFWKLPKKLTVGSGHTYSENSRSTGPAINLFTGFRSSTSSNGSIHSPGFQLSPTSTGHSTPRISSVNRRATTRQDVAEDDRSRANGLCLKRIFPTGTDYLCDALYAHIIAFNYIGLLCPPPLDAELPDVGEMSAVGTLEPSSDARMPFLCSSSPLPDMAEQQCHIIRDNADSDMAPSPAELDDVQTQAPAPADDAYRLSYMTSPRPPSRDSLNSDCGHGHNDNDDGRMISRKAALLLGITDTLEPDGPNSSSRKATLATAMVDNLPFSGSHSNVLARRYNSMRRRRHLRLNHSISESTAAASKMFKKALPGNGQNESYGNNNKARTNKSAHETADAAPTQASGVSAPAATSTPYLLSPAPTSTSAASAAAAASDASMRDLHAGLYACISQLVATMKLTTGQLGNTLLSEEVTREIDPLFLRTLCELVRSQEEQF
ncbi:hypothetical protein SEPCBS119000_000765 [Sporothrix epigloea]|uniref:Uncharacterized protein n=1 Tax=Sporothrix epigloea TaxID=1892477 RepID=A0ABP0D9W9_9PEZI